MFDLEEHFGYLSDLSKIERYREAIKKAVRPGNVVIDVGCGSGLLGLMALRAGASKVIFVDEGSVIEMARHTIELAGFNDRAEFLKGRSYDLDPPEKADVVLCDHIGYFGFDYDILRLLGDARSRWLKADGKILPSRIAPRLAPVSSKTCRELVQRWKSGDAPSEFAWVAEAAANTKHAFYFQADDVIAEPVTLDTLALGASAVDFFVWTAQFRASRDALLDGLAGWFDCVLIEDTGMTNSPFANDRIDRPQAFLPLEDPVALKSGQQIDATIMARPHDNVIAWTLKLPETAQKFELSTFNGLFVKSGLRKSLSLGKAP